MIFRHFFLNGELFDGCICLCSFLFKALWHVLASARQESKQFAQSELWFYVTKSKRPTGHLSTSECVYILKPLNHSMNKASKRSSKPIYQMQQLHTPRCFCSSFLETSAPSLAMCVLECLNFLLHVVGLMTRWMMGDDIYPESTTFWTLCTSMIWQVPSRQSYPHSLIVVGSCWPLPSYTTGWDVTGRHAENLALVPVLRRFSVPAPQSRLNPRGKGFSLLCSVCCPNLEG